MSVAARYRACVSCDAPVVKVAHPEDVMVVVQELAMAALAKAKLARDLPVVLCSLA